MAAKTLDASGARRFVFAALLLVSFTACEATEPEVSKPITSPFDHQFQQEMQRAKANIDKQEAECNALFATLHIGMPESSVQNMQPHGICAIIHTTQTANGIEEQWVWGDDSGRYVYFHNGMLTGIQD
jgi:hypothetical protein